MVARGRVRSAAAASETRLASAVRAVSRVMLALPLVLAASHSQAQGRSAESESPWAFTIEPYLWVSGVNGQIGSESSPTPAGATFIDILQDFKGAFMGAASARYKRVGVVVDGNWVRVGDNVNLPQNGVGLTDVDVGADVAFGTAAAFVRFEPRDGLVVDPYVGSRWWYVDASLDFNPGGPEVDDDTAWADFVAGVMLEYRITPGWFIEAAGDVGGGASDLTWQIYGGTGYNFRDWLGFSIGYRYIGVDYDRDGFLFDSTLDGMLVGFKIRL